VLYSWPLGKRGGVGGVGILEYDVAIEGGTGATGVSISFENMSSFSLPVIVLFSQKKVKSPVPFFIL
jgi:hypothetical protein